MKYVFYLIILFNNWFDEQKAKGTGLVITVGLIFPAVFTITYSKYWQLTVAACFFLMGLFLVRFMWIVMAEDLIKYVNERI